LVSTVLVVSEKTTNMIKAKLYMNVHWMVLYKLYVFCSDMKIKMAATAGLSLTLDGPYGENVSKRFFSETTRTVETKLPWNDHWKVHLGFPIGIKKNIKFVEDLPMTIPGQFGFNYPSGFRIQNGGYGRT
jgi:hypothetical protein